MKMRRGKSSGGTPSKEKSIPPPPPPASTPVPAPASSASPGDQSSDSPGPASQPESWVLGGAAEAESQVSGAAGAGEEEEEEGGMGEGAGGGGGGAIGGEGSKPSAGASAASIQEMLAELYRLVKETHKGKEKSETNLTSIAKAQERIQQEQKITPYYRTKLRGLYQAALSDAENEAELIRKSLGKITDIKEVRNRQRLQARSAGMFTDSDGPRKIMRRGVLMNMLQQTAVTLPLWIGRNDTEKPPPLCGAVSAESSYISKPGDYVAARVRGSDGDENWILAEVISFNPSTNKYEVDDIDEEGKERHLLSRRRIVPLPLMKANPETNPEALFKKGTLVMALYPQTTCFYRALVEKPPEGPINDYSVLFEDNSYADGYSPALNVAQRYVVQVKEPRKR